MSGDGHLSPITPLLQQFKIGFLSSSPYKEDAQEKLDASPPIFHVESRIIILLYNTDPGRRD